VPGEARDLKRAAGVIVPGVGHFGATRSLDRPWVDAIMEHVDAGRPLLGICLGMQWLFEASEEAPELKGLGIFRGTTVRLKPDTTGEADLKVPHVGWNSLSIRRHSASIVDGVDDQSQVYFTHSYVAPVTDATVAVTEHGTPFAAVVQRDRVAGVQFHPEKSGPVGLRILRNFLSSAAMAR
jgi:imidazole glycerol-phosphate synthase subunit HisH